MSLSKSLIVLLSLMLCFCLASKQACAGDAWDYDLPNMMDVPKAECCTNDDSNQPIVLLEAYFYPKIESPIQTSNAEKIYLQPEIPSFLRPPAV